MREVRALGAQHAWALERALLADGRTVFVKQASRPLGDVFASEAAGLRWLGEAGPAAEVVAVSPDLLVLAWVDEERPGAEAAEAFGRALAVMHRAGAGAFGAPWPGFIADLPMDNSPEGSWPEWYWSRRLEPYLRRAADAGSLGRADVALLERVRDRLPELAGPAEPPSRIHGDCWSGNVLWSGGSAVLIDPAAHGGHRETDLAMLALFGAPHQDRIIGAYREEWPLAAGWRERVPLHQLNPLLVHVCLFGASYRDGLLTAARAALDAA
ncbi:fructosamine kinase [Bailinhaonella thermotolerans]|uniref:Fructosamine kinase n=1 Tax=Bailinhaonella thermotolerans TaxID=1070861 RepID=A0A3A4A869_9ACTN|nr:fructosamine kinase family protein [Bailinhaonella thermotolerans]RJL25236.1 fructosamine kinase [Bailinhaonella thermotolerans]